MKLSHVSLPVILVESLAIFCSVLLAFAAEQWRDDLNERARTRIVLELVRTELEENLQELQSANSTRQAMHDGYVEALNKMVDTGQFPRDLPQYRAPELTDVAYQLASESGAISRIQPDQLIVIAKAYEALDEVRRNETFLDNRNAQIRFRDGEQYLSGFIYFANRALINEPDAIRKVEAAIGLL